MISFHEAGLAAHPRQTVWPGHHSRHFRHPNMRVVPMRQIDGGMLPLQEETVQLRRGDGGKCVAITVRPRAERLTTTG